MAVSYYRGFDISNLQGVVDFNALVKEGVSFVICKGYQGNSGIDSMYHTNISRARAAGLKVAAYHFLYPLPNAAGHLNRDPVSQANLHFNAVGGDILACADIEWPAPTDWAKWGIDANFINQWALTYLETYSGLLGRPMPVYTYPDFAYHLKFAAQFVQYPLWIASYGTSTPTLPSPWTTWSIWQTTGGGGKLPNGLPADTDVCPDLSIFDMTNNTVSASTSQVVETQTQPPPPPAPSPSVSAPAPVAVAPSTNIFSAILNFFSKLFGGK